MIPFFDRHSVPGIIEQYKEFLRFPTIGNDPGSRKAMFDCAKWLLNKLRSCGMQVARTFETASHPIVYGEYHSNPSYKTILFYGHYDVVPVGPLQKWNSSPFEPLMRDNYMYSRGASDDKGQIFIQLKAIEFILNQKEKYQVNIKCLFEGDEESGSKHLLDFIRQHSKQLRSDVVIVSDTKMLAMDQPAITYSLRGSFNAELKISNLAKELHSGTYGGMIYDPSVILSKVISALHSPQGKIQIPQYYDTVRDHNIKERKFMKTNGPDNSSLLSDSGAKTSFGEFDYTNYERTTIRPSISVTTLMAGHLKEGFNNSIPSWATAKFNFRLAINQDPAVVRQQFQSFVRRFIPNGCSFSLSYSNPNGPIETDRKNPYMLAAEKAYKSVFNRQVVLLRSGGTIPAVSIMQKELKAPVIMMGFALASDNMHAPNERFYIPNLFRGIRTIIAFVKEVSRFN